MPQFAAPGLLAAVDDEDQRLVWLDLRAGPTRAVAETGRDHEQAASAYLHPLKTLLPALDDLALAERDRERLAAVPAGVEFLAGRPRVAGVVDGGRVAIGGARAGALHHVDHRQLCRRLAARLDDLGLLLRVGANRVGDLLDLRRGLGERRRLGRRRGGGRRLRRRRRLGAVRDVCSLRAAARSETDTGRAEREQLGV